MNTKNKAHLNKNKPLTPLQIKRQCRINSALLAKHTDPATLPRTTNNAAKPLVGFGQERAKLAIRMALDIQTSGYHVFAAGSSSSDMSTIIHHIIKDYFTEHEHNLNTNEFKDWCYVTNFDDPSSPIALSLPAGTSQKFADDITNIWQQAKKQLEHCFNGVYYRGKLQTLKSAATSNESYAAITELQRSLATKALERLFDIYLDIYQDYPSVIVYLKSLQKDLIDNAIAIVKQEKSSFITTSVNDTPSRYLVKVIVNHNDSTSVPIIIEDNPTYAKLFGNIEHTFKEGTFTSDISFIKSGSLHQANGGVLLLHAKTLYEQPHTWQALKYALKTQLIDIKAASNHAFFSNMATLTPEPIKLSVKVVLLGDEDLYDKLLYSDPDFNTLFKIRADFEDDVPRTTDNENAMASIMAAIISKHQLYPFNAKAQSMVLNHLSQLTEDQNKLSLNLDQLSRLLIESSYQANLEISLTTIDKKRKQVVKSRHVKQALQDFEYRSSYLRELYWRDILEGQQLIDFDGTATGQINALTVVENNNFEFATPTRVTAVVYRKPDDGSISDIERDVELGGDLHAKAILIMSSYLRALFSPYESLNFSATLAFEQNYANIDGDSATIAEACALLSALADVPLNQAIAVTGSMNQFGEVQAVGGINTKVEDYFALCLQQGLTGRQGVILPKVNVSHLMLSDELVKAVTKRQFHVYGVNTLKEALAILTGMPIDNKKKSGRYRKQTLFGKILSRLNQWQED